VCVWCSVGWDECVMWHVSCSVCGVACGLQCLWCGVSLCVMWFRCVVLLWCGVMW
jgi:hypothetical protein